MRDADLPSAHRHEQGRILAVLYAVRRHSAEAGEDPAGRGPVDPGRALSGFGVRSFEYAPTATAELLTARARDVAWIEARLDRPFAPHVPQDDAVVFDSEEQILAFADEVRADFLDFARPLRGIRHWRRPTGRVALREIIRTLELLSAEGQV